MKKQQELVEELRDELQEILEKYYGAFFWDNGELMIELKPPLDWIQIQAKRSTS